MGSLQVNRMRAEGVSKLASLVVNGSAFFVEIVEHKEKYPKSATVRHTTISRSTECPAALEVCRCKHVEMSVLNSRRRYDMSADKGLRRSISAMARELKASIQDDARLRRLHGMATAAPEGLNRDMHCVCSRSAAAAVSVVLSASIWLGSPQA